MNLPQVSERWTPVVGVVARAASVSVVVVTILEYGSRAEGIRHEWAALGTSWIALSGTLIHFWGLLDALRRPAGQWDEVVLTKPVWILGLLLVPWLSVVPYVLLVWLPLNAPDAPRFSKDA